MITSSLHPSFAFLLSTAAALQVTPGSNCASVCMDSSDGHSMKAAASTTNSSDIVCSDVDYFSSSVGVKFRGCIECLQTSDGLSGVENDVSWFLYNLRYAAVVCLYDFPTHRANATSTCDLEYACAPLQGALEYGNLDPGNETEYGYCQADDNALYGTGINDCVGCLQLSASAYLANFLISLKLGCQQQPSPGAVLSISGNIFSDVPLNATFATDSTTSSSSANGTNPVLSSSAIVGIAIGVAAIFLLAFVLFIFYCVRERRMDREFYAHLAGAHQSYYKGPGSGGVSFITSNSILLPQYPVDHTMLQQQSAFCQDPGLIEPDFYNNAEYYDQMEGKSRGRPLKGMKPQLQNNQQVGTAGIVAINALPTHPAYIQRSQLASRLGRRKSLDSSFRFSIRSIAKPNAAHRAPSPPAQTLPHPQRSFIPPEDNELPMDYGLQRELGGPTGLSAQPPPYTIQQQGVRTTPGPSVGGGRSTPAPAGDSRAGAPPPRLQPVPRISSLILPPVPRIRGLGKSKSPRAKAAGVPPPPPPQQTYDAGISAPLAFPDRRFQQSGEDRIVEQTIDRNAMLEMPIGSGKSYLYG